MEKIKEENVAAENLINSFKELYSEKELSDEEGEKKGAK